MKASKWRKSLPGGLRQSAYVCYSIDITGREKDKMFTAKVRTETARGARTETHRGLTSSQVEKIRTQARAEAGTGNTVTVEVRRTMR